MSHLCDVNSETSSNELGKNETNKDGAFLQEESVDIISKAPVPMEAGVGGVPIEHVYNNDDASQNLMNIDVAADRETNPPIPEDSTNAPTLANINSYQPEPAENYVSSNEASSSNMEAVDTDANQQKLPEFNIKTKIETDQNSTASDPIAESSFRTDQDQSLNKPSTSDSKNVETVVSDFMHSVYHIKWVQFNGRKTGIVTQNENGPCPLLAVINVLLLQQKITFPPTLQMVTSTQLMEYLGDCVLEYAPKNTSEETQLNYEQNMSDAIAVFHKLQTGLDVNVRFTGVADFEYTPECIVFDLLSIPLYHGWLVDPESPEEVAAMSNCSYNQLVEKIIVNKSSNKPELELEALTAENFLERTASQLTYHGLSQLVDTLQEDALCIFFRNNHFSTLHKHKNELFLLVTDQGFLTECNVVWETLSNVEGDGHFVDDNFRTYTKQELTKLPAEPMELGSPTQIDHDYMIALSMQQDQQQIEEQQVAWQQTAARDPISDAELARQLQEEENKRVSQQQQQPGSSLQRKKEKQCAII